MSKYAIVTTTIFVPKLLDEYAKDAKKFDRDTIFIVIGDKKTPPETAAYCEELAKNFDVPVEYFSPERQEEYLSKWPALRDHIQWNCIMRRNVGLLYAYEIGCESIATIDDDNFLVDEDYLGTHAIDTELEALEIESSTGWMNICSVLKEAHDKPFYHRGFPLETRHTDESWKETRKTITPAVSAGLWLGDPDIDAMTRLYNLTEPIDATAMTRSDRFSPAPKTWTPFNSQNTALARRVIPAYFLSPKVGRYDDIWASYVVKHIADHLGEHIVFGSPLVKQERNPHNYWRDLDMERYGHALSLSFVEALKKITLTGTDFKSCYAEVTDQLPAVFFENTLKDDEKNFVQGYFDGMQIWKNTFATFAE
jgi:hypothetical protein